MSALGVQLEYVVVALWYLFDLLVETWNNVVDLLTLYLVLFFLDLDDLEGISNLRLWQIHTAVADCLHYR